jgi:hypothetical protein
MSATPLRPRIPARIRRTRARPSVEELTARHADLVIARQELRSSGAAETELELNRIEIVRCQWEIAHALIERYMPAVAAA